MARSASTDLRDEEGLEFETRPDLFVLLDRSPIVWTIRGIRHFAPRLRRVGIDIARVRTREQFHAAVRRWNGLELQELVADIEVRAARAEDGLAYQCLQAILEGQAETEALIQALESQNQQASAGSKL